MPIDPLVAKTIARCNEVQRLVNAMLVADRKAEAARLALAKRGPLA